MSKIFSTWVRKSARGCAVCSVPRYRDGRVWNALKIKREEPKKLIAGLLVQEGIGSFVTFDSISRIMLEGTWGEVIDAAKGERMGR